MAQQIQLRHDTAANWTSVNPILMVGEFGYETDTGQFKVGDGATAWASLAYTLQGSSINGTVPLTHGGTGQTTASAAFDALAPTTTKADLIVRGASSNARLGVGTDGYALVADSTQTLGVKWGSIGGGAFVVTGTLASPQNITATGGIAFAGTASRSLWYVQGSGGAVTVTANPQIVAGTTTNQQELMLNGGSDTNPLTLSDGNGLDLNGPMTLYKNSKLYLYWNGSVWSELFRRP